MVRTLGFHPKNRSSILLRSTMEKLIILSTAILIAFAGIITMIINPSDTTEE